MISIINFGSSKTPFISEMVNDLGYASRILKWDECNASELENDRGIIFSGSPVFFTEVDFTPYEERFSFIRAGQKPVLGICFGHQLMGLLHGAKIFRGPEVRRNETIEIVKNDILFQDLYPSTIMAEDHTEGITLPHGFIHLATSDSYLIEAMRHPVLPLYGTQFHPEVSGDNGKKLIGNFLKSYC